MAPAAATKDVPARKNYGVAITWLGMEFPCNPSSRQAHYSLDEADARFVGQGTDRQVFLLANSQYGIYIENRSPHEAVASIIIDGNFQGNFLIPAKGSETIKRGGMRKDSFVFVNHDKEWLKQHTHLPPLLCAEFIGEILVNVRPLWIRRARRYAKFERELLHQQNRSLATAERPLFGNPNVYRVVRNPTWDPPRQQQRWASGQQDKPYLYCDQRPHTTFGADSGQRFFCGLGPLTRGCHSFLFTLKKGLPHRNTLYTDKLDDNGKKYEWVTDIVLWTMPWYST